MPSRRAFISASASGIALGVLPGAIGTPLSEKKRATFIRPPGALPENEFLALCLRCGECMTVCPTNGLQPASLRGGLENLFSPRLDPGIGGCEPDCAACGKVCPSHAIWPLTLSQKRWAKIGTAVIDEKNCLAWGHDKRCMVCKENCPYNAVDVINKAGYAVSLPVVQNNYCYGCGFCQKACPQKPAAIVVEAKGVLRLRNPDYEAAAKRAGLDFTPENTRQPYTKSPDLPPGFLE